MTAAGQVRVKKNILKTPASTGASGGQLLIMYHHQERRDEDLIHRAANTHTQAEQCSDRGALVLVTSKNNANKS